MSDAQGALERLLPLPEIDEVGRLINATVHSVLDSLDDAAADVQGSEGAAAVRSAIERLTGSLKNVQEGVSASVEGIIRGFPGPLLNSTLDVIKRQVSGGQGWCIR
jgi:hypothetical protein